MAIRLNKVINELNIGLQTIVDFLEKKGYYIKATINDKISDEQYELLCKEFASDATLKTQSAKKQCNKSSLEQFIENNKPIDTEDKIDNMFKTCTDIYRTNTNENLLKEIYNETIADLHSYLESAFDKYIEERNQKKVIKKRLKKKKAKKKNRHITPSVFNKNDFVYKGIQIINTPM